MDKSCELLVSFAEVFAAMSPWLVVGFLAAGIIAVWIPRAWVNRVMGGSSGFSGILRAVLVGVPLPICSRGCSVEDIVNTIAATAVQVAKPQ